MQDTLPILCKNCGNYLQELLPHTGKPTTDDHGARKPLTNAPNKAPAPHNSSGENEPGCLHPKEKPKGYLSDHHHSSHGEGVYTPIDIFLDPIPVIPADL